jgi:hypothetical protein
MRGEHVTEVRIKRKSVGGRKIKKVREVHPVNFVYKGLFGEIEIKSK